MISINHSSKVILIPQADLILVSGVLYQLDVNVFRLALKSLEDDADGMVLPTTHRHNTTLSLAGVLYTRSVEIINGYTVEFENGQYTVRCVGANHNLSDVKVPNQVSLIIGNAAGLIEVATGSVTPEQIAEAVWNRQVSIGAPTGSFAEIVAKKLLSIAKFIALK